MYFLRKLIIISCLFKLGAGLFAAAEIDERDADRKFWAEALQRYKDTYNQNSRFFDVPVEEDRVPVGIASLGVKDGYRLYQEPVSGAFIFGVTSSVQRKMLMEKIDFLFRLIYSCGQQYHIASTISPPTDRLSTERLFTSNAVFYILDFFLVIANTLKNRDYIDERDLNSLYNTINGQILQHQESQNFFELVEVLYNPIKSWILENFPLSPMFKYVVNKSEIQSGIGCVSPHTLVVNNIFDYASYFNGYHKTTKRYEEITHWLDGSKTISASKISADQELKQFEAEIQKPFNQTDMQGNDMSVVFIRYVESVHNKGEALLDKWSKFIDDEKEELGRRVREKEFERQAKLAKPKDFDPKTALAAMMKELGLEDDSKKASTKPPKVRPATKELKHTSKDVKVDRLEEKRRKVEEARRQAEEEKFRLVQLEETARQNSERNAAVSLRQAELRQRRQQEAEGQRLVKEGLLRREATWVDALYEETQRLSALSESERLSASLFSGQPNYQEVITALKRAGIYIIERIHGNEKCLATWKDAQNRNVMVWYDYPHGVQLESKGAAAGWVIALRKALRDSERLLPL